MLDTLYTDFTNKVLPAIQEGLIITQEYFTDLFGRYVKFLIVTDAIYTFIGFVLMVGSVLVVRPWFKSLEKYESGAGFCVALLLFPLVFGAIIFFTNGTNLLKAIYIPEVRVYEELRPLLNK